VQRCKQQHSKASSHGMKVSSGSNTASGGSGKQVAKQQHWREASSGTATRHGVAAANGKQASRQGKAKQGKARHDIMACMQKAARGGQRKVAQQHGRTWRAR
jgi:hypothetical protein